MERIAAETVTIYSGMGDDGEKDTYAMYGI
jgi:hypothetical protein